jgi:hypothetical protein
LALGDELGVDDGFAFLARHQEKTIGRSRERLWEMKLVPWWECP